MKGVINKCGLLLALPIMLGLSCVISSDVNALKYNVNTIPLGLVVTDGSLVSHHLNGYRYSYAFNDPFSIGSHTLTTSDFSDSFFNNYTYNMFYDSAGERCTFDKGRRMYNPQYSGSGSDSLGDFSWYNFDFPYYASDLTYHDSLDSLNDQFLCNKNGIVNDPSPDLNTFPPYIFGNPNYRALAPYRYGYNGIYRFDSHRDDGLDINTKFSFVDLFKSDSLKGSNDITSLSIPLGRASSSFDDIHVGGKVLITGSFYLDTDNSSDDEFDFDDSSTASLLVKGYPDGWTQNSPDDLGTSVCDISYRSNPNSLEAPHIIDYGCVWYSNYDFVDSSLLGFTLKFNAGADKHYIFSFSNLYFWSYDTSIVITNDDPTPAETGFSDFVIDGNDAINAPGSASHGVASPDYDSSLTDMFSFGFLNPFAPIFNLFSDQNSCAQIPTIAGMIHSNETQVCPWFDSNTRNIVTPVLGLSSMMLIFGFAVRWLGGGSGNMFIDDDIKDTGHNFSLFNKYKRR